MRVLLIKMSSLGDVVHALPAVSDAAAHGITFDWVVEEAFADIPALHPAVHQVIPIAWRRWRKNL
ncbi:MAG: lipopolysaccharide heptosyltransferase 1, partial [Pseudomonadales bacterium]|nr:lipopolysaccharide heptosyltransferase 1 [Pseudomonadales bacterium]